MTLVAAFFSQPLIAQDGGLSDRLGSPNVVINEVDADQAGTEDREFVELFGNPNTPLDGFVLVFFNGNGDTSYLAVDLDGQTLDSNGFFVAGGSGIASVDVSLPDSTVQNGADAVALYTANDTDFPNGTAVTTTNLVDAVVYGTNDADDAGLLVLLNGGQPQVNEDGAGDKDAHSNSRVPDGGTARNTDTYVQQDPTPGAPNQAGPATNVVINEVDADTAGTDTLEFVELFGNPNTSLDGLVLVLFNGSNDQSFLAIDLDGESLDANGFFVAGNTAVTAASVTFPDNTLQNGADAVALYVGDDTDFPNGTGVTTTDLVDALVYDTNDGDDAGLLALLNAGQPQVNEDGMGDKDGHSNSRVPDGGTARNTDTYVQQAPTPGASNQTGPSTDIVINEVDADTAGSDTLEFVELFGTPNTSLDGFVLVLFNGSNDQSYFALDLDGQSLDANGFFVAGNTAVTNVDVTFPDNTLQNGADAVALFMGDDTDFPNGTGVTTTNLVDALVYDTNDGDDAGLLALLNGGQAQINEDELGNKDGHSNSRVPDGGTARNTDTYVQQDPTPGASNQPTPSSDIVINEVDADTPSSDVLEFVELFGTPNTSLDGFVLVFYNGSSDQSYRAIDLDGQSLDANGFFVAGNTGVANVDVTFPDNGLQNGADAVALYMGNDTDFPDGTAVTTTDLVDAVVYDTNDGDDAGLLVLLNAGQPQLNEDGAGDKDIHSNSRVPDGGTARNTDTFVQQLATPGASNQPAPSELVINEVDADTAGSDTLEFVELFGTPNASLNGFVLVFFNGSSDQSYLAIDLDGQSLDANGFFVAGNTGVANVDVTFADNGLQNGADAVALYTGDDTDFPTNTPVTTTNLVDALVYDTNDGDDAGLLVLLNAGQAQINEDDMGDKDGHSNSRFPDGGTPRDTDSYTQQTPTPGESNVAGGASVTIAEIQGNGLTSPFDGQTVRTEGNVVTAVGAVGFFIQTPDANVDADPETSEGVYVFLNTAPTVSVGDIVNVEGPIVEFFDFTEFAGAGIVVDIVSSGNPLPAVITFDGTTPSPNQPQPDTELERFEGMLVTMSGIAAGPTDQFGDTPVVATTTRPFVEPGITFPGQVGLPVYDGNPEIFEINSTALGGPAVQMHAGQTVNEATGPLAFSFGDYQIWPTTLNPATPDFSSTPVRNRESGEFTVASQNMLRLYDDVNDGNGDSTVSAQEYQDRLTKFSMLIRNVLGAPDILAVQEVEKIEVLQDLASQINTDDSSINYTAYLLEGNDPGTIDVGYLVRDTVSVNDVSQVQENETFDFNSNSFTLHDRPPLVLDATVDLGNGENYPIVVMVVHHRSRNDIDEDPGSGEFVRFKRNQQALRTSQHIQSMQNADPDIHLMVVGDFNAYEFTDGYVDVVGQMTGDLDPLGALIPGTDEVNPDLHNHIADLPAAERYSFVFRGSSNAFEHVLTSQSLTCAVSEVQYARGNADMPRDLEDDPGTPSRASDHDGSVAYVKIPGILVTPTSGLTTSETGTTAQFTVVLQSQPSADVTIAVASSDTTEGTVDVSSLTFTSSNWDTAQTVTITGVDDDVIDGSQAYTIQLSPVVSTDLCYSGVDPADVGVTNTSKDAATIVVDPTTDLVVDEDGTTAQFTVVLGAQPSADVTVSVSSDNEDEGTVDVNALTFTNGNWDQPQTVTVTGVFDGVIDNDIAFTVVLGAATSTDPDFDNVDPDDVAVTNLNTTSSLDFSIRISGDTATILGPNNGAGGFYYLDPDTGEWVFVANFSLNGDGQAVIDVNLPDDVIVGVGGLDGLIQPTSGSGATVPTLGEWGLIAFALLLMMAAVKSSRDGRRRA
ncbi:endonuclease/exonuclease/phosphatase family protein [Sulfidibacter corallicola]|uniref:LTD domain-containing protein n=1 Tax=Sulfidibacter corallicola TaxID=2818388 RepID=A0A8A4TG99_SULCO|nr:hypothetical protein [Sulfidibacter corallicola]QTD47748.1 hypothetical protein J3U87_19340 [Sulfidibacter corallicola]